MSSKEKSRPADTEATEAENVDEKTPSPLPDLEPGVLRRRITARRPRRKRNPSYDHVVTCFAACDRCSFFLAGYWASHGMENLREAVQRIESDWLTLTWDSEMRDLVYKSFGSRLDIGCRRFNGACPNCRRPFSFWAETEEAPASFHISL